MAHKACPRCESSVGLPHRSDRDCFRELDREIAGVVARLRALTKRKGQLLRERIRSRQKAVVRKGAATATRRTRLVALMGPKGRPPSSPFAARRFGRNR